MGQASYWGCPPFRTDIVENPLVPEDGMLELPNEPGLGVTLDEDALEKYPYEEGPVQEEWVDHPFE
jgi:L-alanine-DL-glutamate epimerase-like enolase superfamily enzyme